MLFLHYLLCVCVQEKKESRLNSINHRIPASRKLSPPQTAIKCSVLRKWPIESMCVCVCFTWQNNRLVVFFLLEWVEDPCLWRQNKQVHSDFCSFSANGRPSEPWMSWHTERDCGFYFFFPFISVVENAHVTAGTFSGKMTSDRNCAQRESASFAYLFLQLIL